jgi:hypothetical protein
MVAIQMKDSKYAEVSNAYYEARIRIGINVVPVATLY